jgi:phage terminase small subunit
MADRAKLKEEARKLYKAGVPMAQIAKDMDVPAGTIRRWKSEGNWDDDLAAACERAIKKNERSQKKASVRRKKTERSVTNKNRDPDRSRDKRDADEENDTSSRALNEKEHLFCVEYLRCFNASKAYKRVHPDASKTTCYSNGYKWLKKTQIRCEIDRMKQEQMEINDLTMNDIVRKYMDIAFADVSDFMEFGMEKQPVIGAFGPVKVKNPETGEEQQLMVDVNVVKFKQDAEVDGSLIAEISQGKSGAKIKLADRMKALEWLANHYSMLNDEQKDQLTGVIELAPILEIPEEEDEQECDMDPAAEAVRNDAET